MNYSTLYRICLYIVLLIGFVLGGKQITNGQTNQQAIDSLNTIIKIAQDDTAVSRAYVDLSSKLFRSHTDTVIALCNKALSIIELGIGSSSDKETTAFLLTKANALNNIGLVYYQKGEMDTALNFYTKSLAISEDQDDKLGISSCYHNIGSIFKSRGDIKKALENYHKTLNICQDEGYKQGITSALNNIGLIYIKQRDYNTALELFNKSMKLQEEMNDTWGLINSFNNIGLIYGNLGEEEKELEYYEKALFLAEESGDKQNVARAYNNIGRLYRDQEKRAKAIYYFEKSLEILQDLEYNLSIPFVLNNIGALYLYEGDIDKAQDYSERALLLSTEMGSTENISQAAEVLSKILEQQGSYDKALEYHMLHVQMQDSLFNEENTKKIMQLEAKMEYENKLREKKSELEKKQAVQEERLKRYLYIGIMVLLLILVVSAGVFLGLRQRLNNQKLGAELSFLKSQINPHFLFNTLNNIYALVLKKSTDAPNAVLMLSDIMRYMLHDSNHHRVLLEKEIDYISKFIKLQQLRIKKDVNIEFNIQGEPNKIKIAPMLLIPFVENAFKHGELQQKDAYIKIQLDIIPGEIDFLVENILREKKEKTTSGIGLDNLKKRLSLIYPGKHKLSRRKSGTTYIGNLKLQL